MRMTVVVIVVIVVCHSGHCYVIVIGIVVAIVADVVVVILDVVVLSLFSCLSLSCSTLHG